MSAHNDDIDAEFQSLVASLGETGTEASSQPTRDPDDTPVDESLHLEGGRLSVALVLAPIAYPEALHSLTGAVERPRVHCASQAVDCRVVTC